MAPNCVNVSMIDDFWQYKNITVIVCSRGIGDGISLIYLHLFPDLQCNINVILTIIVLYK